MAARKPACPHPPAMTGKPLNNPRQSPAVMVIHGPEIFDYGDAARLLMLLAPFRTLVAGVMARTAAEESGLPVEFDGRPPSVVIRDTDRPVFLANHGKTPHSGRVFGEIVASRLGSRGLVHIECSDARVFCWNNGDLALAKDLAARTEYVLEEAAASAQLPVHTRQIRGCIPGEPVFVNGIVIGRATADVVVLRSWRGHVEATSGLLPKPHGMEKLLHIGSIDISTAWCKSGAIRSVAARHCSRAVRYGRIMAIDHCGHDLYAQMSPDCCGVLAIGDDTTAVCGHICSHRGIPVLGITDNDADTILPSTFTPGSVVLDTRPGRDDDIGREIAGMVPEVPVRWDDWVQEVLARLAGRVSIALDLREDTP
ncbi:MAG: DUF2117 domain-containing protein [Methanoregula sp.]|nr:DUF2117 domain-containing protein [Methanoregula sp.]